MTGSAVVVLTREVTLPGFRHDLYGSSHVWVHLNPAFRKELQPELEKHGLRYIWSDDHITGHPNLDGQGIIVYKDVDKTCDHHRRILTEGRRAVIARSTRNLPR